MKCCKRYCDRAARAKFGKSMYCEMHCRIRQMRVAARHDKKRCPEHGELEAMAMRLVRLRMRCDLCDRRMNWMKRDGIGTCVSLQHDRSGEVRLICLACNIKHGQLPGDSYYDIPIGNKWCGGCELILPVEAFYKSTTKANGLCSQCKACTLAALAKYKKANRAKLSAAEHARRKRRAKV